MRVAMLAALVLAASCGDGEGGGPGGLGGSFSCRAVLPGADGGTGMLALCIEGSGGTAQDLATNRQSCAAQGNMFAEEPCPHGGALGGCRYTTTLSNVVVTNWYYANGGLAAADVQAICDGLATGLPSVVQVQFVHP